MLERAKALCPLLLITTLTVACGGAAGGSESPADREWVSETSTEGNITTVRTISGSVWGGTAQLTEETSIGVESGEDPYMLGLVRAVAEYGDEIFVLDQQVPTIRVYDLSGRHLRDLGSEGSGPGELQRPESMVIGPEGRIYVRDPRNGRIMILSTTGEELGVIRITSGFSTSTPMVVTSDGTLYNYELLNQGAEVTDWSLGMVPQYEDESMVGEPILAPDFDFEPLQIVARQEGGMSVNNVPFSPSMRWTMSPSRAVIGGVSDDYSFEIRYPDGRITRVEKDWEPVPVQADEADWRKRSATANMRQTQPDWTWTVADIPEHKPAFSDLRADLSGRIWVQRPGPGYHVDEECNEDPEPGEPFGTACWSEKTTWEVFDEEGRFLGGAELPEGLQPYVPPYIRDDVFLTAYIDDMGTVMVKRFRIVLPGN
ncbi:MAG: 6-bladed beta-propeller [Acidobacteriota bacterium]|jgi:hypothetical protein